MTRTPPSDLGITHANLAEEVRQAIHCECGKERHEIEAEAALGTLLDRIDHLERERDHAQREAMGRQKIIAALKEERRQ